jgi:hypothetical protein
MRYSSDTAVERALGQAIERLRAPGGVALGGTIYAGTGEFGQPVFKESEPTRQANFAARSIGQRLTPRRRRRFTYRAYGW